MDLSLTDPDFSKSFQILRSIGKRWELTEDCWILLLQFEHIENALFAGLGVTREILTGEGTYSGNKINLEILNTQYMLFREQLQDFVQRITFSNLSQRKKVFEETDKFGRKKLLYPHLSFARLAVKDNDAFFR